jgi:hypothetical protein
MIRSVTILSAVLVGGVAAGALAADPQPASQLAASNPGQSAYSTPGSGPKASGGANTTSDHFVKPPGYDQNPDNFPYTREGVLKPN